MKTDKHHFKNAFLPFSLIACLVIAASFRPVSVGPNLSGSWVLNVSKSVFGDNPLYVAPKQLKIANEKETLSMELLVIAVSGGDSTMNVKLSLTGKTNDMITADQRTRHYHSKWTDNDSALKVEYSSSYSGKPGEEEYHTLETWKLSADGKELILDKEVKVVNGYEYAVKAVYEKKQAIN